MYAFYQASNDLYPVSVSAVEDAQKYAISVYPQEACGIVPKYKKIEGTVQED